MGARLATLSFERIDLRLGVVPLRATILEAPSACVEKDIPVVCSTLTLDVRSMDCQESHLERFINAVTRAATTKDTITFRTGNVHTQRTEGDNGGDLSGNILMLLRCIGQLGYEVSLDLSGLFSTCQEDKNCQAVVRGLIEFIFPRSSPMGLTLAETVVVTDEDDAVFRRETIRWRQDHPGQKLRLWSLRLWLEIGCVESVRTLVAILDDVVELSIDWIEDEIVEEDIKAMNAPVSEPSQSCGHKRQYQQYGYFCCQRRQYPKAPSRETQARWPDVGKLYEHSGVHQESRSTVQQCEFHVPDIVEPEYRGD